MDGSEWPQPACPQQSESPAAPPPTPGDRWLAAMRRGDLDAAWRVSDEVLAARDPATRDDPALPYHLRWVWDGRPVGGRRVLVRCYHGLGDTLQFCRYLPALGRRAAHVAVEAQPELIPLLRALPGVDRWIAFRQAHPEPPAEVDLEIMDLAHALRLPPPAPPYLSAPPLRPDPCADAAPRDPAPRVGLCWRAGGWDPDRSLPLRLLRPLAEVPGLRWVSLQRGPAAREALDAGSPAFVNPGDTSMDVARTAALIAGLDLVVTVDTMVAHLAGALGRPCWVLLKHEADWRWPLADTAAPWYPRTRPYRQSTPGDWTDPIERLRADLARLAARDAHGSVICAAPPSRA